MIKLLLFRPIIKFLEKVTGKKITYYKKGSNILGKTAAKSSFGFWYAGNVVDFGDLAYGILENGLVEKDDTDLVIKILKILVPEKNEDFIFYDIGANTGYYGILSAYLFRDKVVVNSFEPIFEHADCLNETVKMNNLEKNIRIFTVALGDIEKEAEIYISGTGSSLLKDFMSDKTAPARKVKQTTIDILSKRGEITLPDFIKIDVEGFELNVLKGSEEVIKKNQPIIFYETVYSLSKIGFVSQSYEETVKLLEGWGYILYKRTPMGLIKEVGQEKPDEISMFLCLHKEKHRGLFNKINL